MVGCFSTNWFLVYAMFINDVLWVAWPHFCSGFTKKVGFSSQSNLVQVMKPKNDSYNVYGLWGVLLSSTLQTNTPKPIHIGINQFLILCIQRLFSLFHRIIRFRHIFSCPVRFSNQASMHGLTFSFSGSWSKVPPTVYSVCSPLWSRMRWAPEKKHGVSNWQLSTQGLHSLLSK